MKTRDRAVPINSRIVLYLTLLSGAMLATNSASAQQPETTASIYLWVTNVNEKLTNGAEVDIDNSTMIDNLDFAFEGNLEHRRGNWLYGFDVVYADVGKSENLDVPVDGGSVTADTDVNSSTTVLSGYAGYRLVKNRNWELYGTGGLRYANFDTTLKTDADDAGVSYRLDIEEDPTDVIVGLRGAYTIDQNWAFPFLVDVGGGGSDLTWQAYGAVSYSWGPNTVSGGYRCMNWQLDSDSKYLDEVTYDGPLLAYSFHF